MSKTKSYLDNSVDEPVVTIIKAIDKDVERGEDMLMLGLCLVMLSSTFAPVAPPTVLLPLVALTFAISSGFARKNYHDMERKFHAAMVQLERRDKAVLRPIAAVFAEHPMPPLVDSYNMLKNVKRTWKSVLGGIIINPLWMPIFYVMGIQIIEEKNLGILNRAICGVEQKIAPLPAMIEEEQS
ncbi:MAG: hypothetical protein PHH59_16340 [Methylovulum sp.]|uniref:hypothetical protein n=1 Tax=Methylovulum sp. TaxID=1916980 RepID=UPI0026186170|nr:hypothetical protein [Methylovulum sp.]MDD2725573.1 hypothetical protein [Methylovulum sp.]MDD5126423.1 hypothetical protein [Methylovulum sp.]